MSDHVSHPYKTTERITVLDVLILTLLCSNLVKKEVCGKNGSRSFADLSAPNFFMHAVSIGQFHSQALSLHGEIQNRSYFLIYGV
jgi:hypothetical protein